MLQLIYYVYIYSINAQRAKPVSILYYLYRRIVEFGSERKEQTFVHIENTKRF